MRVLGEFGVLTLYGGKPRLSRQPFKENGGGKRQDFLKKEKILIVNSQGGQSPEPDS